MCHLVRMLLMGEAVRVCVCSVISDSCDLVDCSPPGSFVHGISQTRMLDWVVIFSCSGSS